MMWVWFNLLPLGWVLWVSKVTMLPALQMSPWNSSNIQNKFYYGMDVVHTEGQQLCLNSSFIEVLSYQSYRWHSRSYSTMLPSQYTMACWCLGTQHYIRHFQCSHLFWTRICLDKKHWCIPICTSIFAKVDRWILKHSLSGCGWVSIRESSLWSWVSAYSNNPLSESSPSHSLL